MDNKEIKKEAIKEKDSQIIYSDLNDIEKRLLSIYCRLNDFSIKLYSEEKSEKIQDNIIREEPSGYVEKIYGSLHEVHGLIKSIESRIDIIERF
jgi:hypothetical protein